LIYKPLSQDQWFEIIHAAKALHFDLFVLTQNSLLQPGYWHLIKQTGACKRMMKSIHWLIDDLVFRAVLALP